jgi:hypothetical protein
MPTLHGKARYLASLNDKINEAVHAVSVAQEELAVAVSRLVSVGDKRLITPGRAVSFEKLRTAQDHVRDLQQRLARA